MKKLIVISIVVMLTSLGGRLFAQDAENVEQVGSLYHPWHHALYARAAGDLAFVIAGDVGLAIMDISNPNIPRLLGNWSGNGVYGDIAIAQEYVYISGSEGILVISVSDPANPELIGSLDVTTNEETDISGDYLYILTRGGLSIISIADRENPVESGFIGELGDPVYVSVVGDYAYIATRGQGFYIVNIENPEDPQLVEIFDYQYSVMDAEASGNHVYLVASDGIHVIDVEDPNNPEEIANFDEFRDVRYLAISGEYACLIASGREDLLAVVSIADPENIVEVGRVQISSAMVSFTVTDNLAFAATWFGLKMYSFADPESPTEIGYEYPLYSIKAIIANGDYNYILDIDTGLHAILVDDPESPIEVGHTSAPNRSIIMAIDGDYAYTGGYGKINIISISDPHNLEEVALIDSLPFNRIHEIAIHNQNAYIAAGVDGLRILSLVDPESPEEIGFYSREGIIAEGLTVTDSIAYIAYNIEQEDGELVGGLQIISISDPEHPQEMGFYQTEGRAMDVAISGDIAYLADGGTWEDLNYRGGGIHVMSISDHENPEEIGFIELENPVHRIKLSGQYIYIANAGGGLRVFSIDDPENPVEVGHYDRPGSAWDLSLSENGLIHVAEKYHMGIYRFTDPNAVTDPSRTTPLKYKLYAAYPNPFNAQTKIAYDLPTSANVKLSILDINGRTVDVLDQGMRTLGQHRLIWDGSGFVSGTYFVRLEAGGSVINQKAVLIK